MREDNRLYIFKFSSYETIYNHSAIDRIKPLFEIQTLRLEDMFLFLKQHGFDNSCGQYIYTTDVNDYDEDLCLKYWNTGSNNSPKDNYKIITTTQILEEVMCNIVNSLTQLMSFGPLVLETDKFELMHNIVNCFGNINYTNIEEVVLADNTALFDKNRFGEFVNNDDEAEINRAVLDDLYEFIATNMYESLHSVIPNNIDLEDKLPFTIEGYSSVFANMMTDSM